MLCKKSGKSQLKSNWNESVPSPLPKCCSEQLRKTFQDDKAREGLLAFICSETRQDVDKTEKGWYYDVILLIV